MISRGRCHMEEEDCDVKLVIYLTLLRFYFVDWCIICHLACNDVNFILPVISQFPSPTSWGQVFYEDPASWEQVSTPHSLVVIPFVSFCTLVCPFPRYLTSFLHSFCPSFHVLTVTLGVIVGVESEESIDGQLW